MKQYGDYFRFTHDILVLAAKHGLDVFILCVTLASKLAEEAQRRHTGRGLSDGLREILAATGNVSIIIWSEGDDIAPSILSLMKESKEHNDWGTLDIRVSGTTSGNLSSFLVARSRDESEWMVRLEKPHAWKTSEDAEQGIGPAVMMRNTEDAASSGKMLLEFFSKISKAIEDQAKLQGVAQM